MQERGSGSSRSLEGLTPAVVLGDGGDAPASPLEDACDMMCDYMNFVVRVWNRGGRVILTFSQARTVAPHISIVIRLLWRIPDAALGLEVLSMRMGRQPVHLAPHK